MSQQFPPGEQFSFANSFIDSGSIPDYSLSARVFQDPSLETFFQNILRRSLGERVLPAAILLDNPYTACSEKTTSNVRGSKNVERAAFDDTEVSEQEAKPSENIPRPGEFGKRLAEAVMGEHERMMSTGYCATAVQSALEAVGLPQFSGCGNAWDMLEPLEASGLFVRVPESKSAVGDLIVRPPSRDPAQNSIYGDISVVTSRDFNTIIQTNDASYEYVRDNPRYDGQAVFLRYAGDRTN